MNRFKIHTLLATMLLGCVASISAQDYEDDIYYNPDKAKAKKTTNTTAVASKSYSAIPAADTYTQGAVSQRAISVDDYNRRGIFSDDSASAQAEGTPDFACTRRIEQFYNPDVVTASSDPDLAQYYYSEPASSVNIIVNNPYPSYWGYPYYGRAWAWANPYYSYWGAWDPWYGPSWSWSWNWNWGWSYPSWAWRPAWSHRPGWGWAGPVRPNRPSGYQRPGYSRPAYGSSRPGYSRPAYGSSRPGYSRPAYGTSRPGNGYSRPGYSRPGYGTSRPGSSSGSNKAPGYSRPGSSGSSNSGYSRPGNSGNSYRPGNSGNSYRPSTGSGSGYSRGSGSSGGYSRGSGSSGGYSGGSRGGGGGGRGRH